MPKKDGSPTVAEKRAARKASGEVRPGSVADNRAKAQEKAQTMLQYKIENNINKAKTREKEQRQLPARQQREGSVAYNRANNIQPASTGNSNQSAGGGVPQTNSNKFSTAAGYQMEKGAYNKGVTDMYEQYKKDNPSAGLSHMRPGLESFDENGYLSYDSEKPQWQANNMLKDMGYKVGDMLWKPGSLDNLNGRKLTGRIGSISASGNYHPELEFDAMNSNHLGSGSKNYGQVGLGADQAAYNKAEWEKRHK